MIIRSASYQTSIKCFQSIISKSAWDGFSAQSTEKAVPSTATFNEAFSLNVNINQKTPCVTEVAQGAFYWLSDQCLPASVALPACAGRAIIFADYSLRKRENMAAICARVALSCGFRLTSSPAGMPLMMPSLVAQIIASTA